MCIFPGDEDLFVLSNSQSSQRPSKWVTGKQEIEMILLLFCSLVSLSFMQFHLENGRLSPWKLGLNIQNMQCPGESLREDLRRRDDVTFGEETLQLCGVRRLGVRTICGLEPQGEASVLFWNMVQALP